VSGDATAAGDVTVGHPAPLREVIAPGLLAVAVLAAPVAWSLEVLVNLSVTGLACYPKDQPLASPLVTWPGAVLTGVQIVVFAIGIAGAIAAAICWRRVRRESQGDANTLVAIGAGRTRFLAMCGIMLTTIFLVAMVFTATAFAMIRLC
jgi:hypothetical protein